MKSTISYTNTPWFLAQSSLIEVGTEQISRTPLSIGFILDVVSLRLMQDHSPLAHAAKTNNATDNRAILIIQLMIHTCFIIASWYCRAL